MTFEEVHKKKRVGKACDCCRIKKTKCDGKKPCNRCILDNKICIFTDKKKLYQKTYPLGYVELLETRLSLLTKSLEILVAKNNMNINGINDMVMHLIQNEDLLTNLPIEWDQGALIAAKFDEANFESSIEKFKQKYEGNDEVLSDDSTRSVQSTESLTSNFQNLASTSPQNLSTSPTLHSPRSPIKSPDYIRRLSNSVHKPIRKPKIQVDESLFRTYPDSLFKQEFDYDLDFNYNIDFENNTVNGIENTIESQVMADGYEFT